MDVAVSVGEPKLFRDVMVTMRDGPFLSRLAAVRCAFRWVASIMMRSGRGPSPARAAKMRLKA